MAKINITRIFETSRALGTDVGQKIADFISYCAEAFAQIIAALRNALTFEDNFNCLISEPTLTHGVQQILNTGGKNPRGILVTRSYSISYPIDAFTWHFDDSGNVIVVARFYGGPTTPIKVTLVVLF
jgi:hypothetical protein